MWLMVSSLSLQSQYLLFCCVLSILALIWLVHIALFYAAIRKVAVSLLMIPFLFFFFSYVHVFSCEMLFRSRLKRQKNWIFSPFFPCYFHFVVHRVASIVSYGCNQSSFVFFYVVPRVVLSMRQDGLQWWQILFFTFFYMYRLLTLPLGYNPVYQPSTRAGYDTRSIFKRCLTGLNSEFSFS